MYTVAKEPLETFTGFKLRCFAGETLLSYGEVLEVWRRDALCRKVYIFTLKGIPFTAFRWETPPVTKETLDRAFECAVIDHPELERPADASAFREKLSGLSAQTQVTTFANLDKDATLIVPTKQAENDAYGHLAAFSKKAPYEQQDKLWQEVGALMLESIDSDPIWLNTAGDGVPWLHIRLDSRPKYYWYKTYKLWE